MKLWVRVVCFSVICWMGPQLFAEDASRYFIGAQAGLVNHVEGTPLLFVEDQPVSRPLLPRMMIPPRSRVETRKGDRVEILLNPGSYLRVDENSIVRLNETKLADVRLALDQGTLIVESGVLDKKTHSLVISTAAGEVAIEKAGLYRFDADPDQSKVGVVVRRGKAEWTREGHPQMALKSGKRFELPVPSSGAQPQVATVAKESSDGVDQWSFQRAQSLVAASDRTSSWASDSWYSAYSQRGFRGGWFFDPFYQMFTYIPFSGGYYSPYGFSYLGYYPYRLYRGYYGGYGGSSGRGSTGGVAGSASSPTVSGSSNPTRGTAMPSSAPSNSPGMEGRNRGTAIHRSSGR
ncbi:MAG: FecR family protein [Terriglobia bacterium]